MLIRKMLVVVLFIAVACSPLVAATLHVPADYPTIQDAVDAASDGDVVLIAPGVYYENIFLSNVTITLASHYLESEDEADISRTIIDGQDDTVLVIHSDDPATAVIGLTIQNGDDGISASGNFQLLHNRIIGNVDGIDYESGGGLCRWNLFEANYDDGIDLDGACEVIIEDCIIVNNADDGIEIRLHPYDGRTLHTVIRRNLIQGNGEDGIQFIDYSTDSSRVFRIEHNVIADSAMAALGFMGDTNTRENYEAYSIPERIFFINNTVVDNHYGVTGGDNIVILNNIFTGTANIALKQVDGNSIAAYNMFWNNGTDVDGSVWLQETCVFSNPLVDEEFQLLAGSPCIDAGVLTFEWEEEQMLAETDFEHTIGAPDLGAHEHDPTSD